jgi:UDPglucose 6-dehydrogenase
MQATVLGAGYVGLTTAVCLAKLGHSVTAYDASPERSTLLRAGSVPFHERGLPELLQEGISSGRLCIAESIESALEGADLVLVCVGTPLDDSGTADLAQVRSACGSIADHAPEAQVVIRSTLPLGETANAALWLRRDSLDGVVTNPEFLRQGNAVEDFLAPTRIVLGTPDGATTRASELVLELYADISAPILVTDFNSAEMIKNAANAFLATKLSFVNEVADLCEAYGADVKAVVRGIGLDPRIGSTYLSPGIGFGGSCLPKELANMVRLGEQRDVGVPLMKGAAQTNEGRAARTVDRIESLAGPVRDSRIALLGLAFKAGTDDIRYSPALAMAKELAGRGATVVAQDPVVPMRATEGIDRLQRADEAASAFEESDLVIVATEWPEYGDLDWHELMQRVRRPIVFDGRSMLNAGDLRDDGWTVIEVGRAAS